MELGNICAFYDFEFACGIRDRLLSEILYVWNSMLLCFTAMQMFLAKSLVPKIIRNSYTITYCSLWHNIV